MVQTINFSHFIAHLRIVFTSIELKITVFSKSKKPFLVKEKFINRLRILYTQLLRIMLVAHVLPRLLAHVLATTSIST